MNWLSGLWLIGVLSLCFSLYPLVLGRLTKGYYFLVLIFPSILVFATYWVSAMVYGVGEYRDWAYVFMVPWLMGGYVGSMLGLFFTKLFLKT